MARALVRFLPFEMALLGLFELPVLFALVFTMQPGIGKTPLTGLRMLPTDGLELTAMLAATIAGTALVIGLYRTEICLDRRRLLICGATAAALAFPGILLVSDANRVILTGEHIICLGRLLAIWLSFVLAVRYAFGVLYPRMPAVHRVLIIGGGDREARLRRRLLAMGQRYQAISRDFEGAAPSLEFVRRQRIWGIVVAHDGPAPISHEILLENKLRGVPVLDDISFQERHLGRVELETVDANWLLFADGFHNGMMARIARRALDIVVASLILVAALPLMLLTAMMIKCDSRGPVLYRQERTGLHGRSFTLLKFRSMTVDAEAAGCPQWAQLRDPRVTRVGAFIRACRIDELPQLLNILRGDMSMVGPRPERPEFTGDLARIIPFYNHRCYVKPGLTGWAQVNYPYGASIEDAREKLAYDLWYVKNRGLLLDVVILLSTVRVVLFGEGAR
jgi:exopolysaccharide biosynthesis polyprenyl glycosylphosphotransferase